MFERTLQDLIRGLRAHKASSRAQEDAFLAEAMGEIRDELRGKDMPLKAEAVLKMCYVSRVGEVTASCEAFAACSSRREGRLADNSS
jgi:hypothetical protein